MVKNAIKIKNFSVFIDFLMILYIFFKFVYILCELSCKFFHILLK